LPNGRTLVVPGKHIKAFNGKPLASGFEDMTEEIAEKPDYDYQQPCIEVIREFFYKISIDKWLHVQNKSPIRR